MWLSARTCDLSFYLFERPMPGKKEVKTWKKEAGMERCKPQRNTATACPCTFRARTLASLSLSEKRIQTCHARSTSALVLFRVVRWSRGILVSDVALLGVENCHKQSLMETQMNLKLEHLASRQIRKARTRESCIRSCQASKGLKENSYMYCIAVAVSVEYPYPQRTRLLHGAGACGQLRLSSAPSSWGQVVVDTYRQPATRAPAPAPAPARGIDGDPGRGWGPRVTGSHLIPCGCGCVTVRAE